MTKISGYLISACPNCGTHYRRPMYSSMNFMAHEQWTDGHTEGSLMPRSGFMRLCIECKAIYHVGDLVDSHEISNEDVYTFVEEPAPPPKTLLQKAWRTISGELPPQVHRVLRDDLPPYIEYVPDSECQAYLDGLLKMPSNTAHHALFEFELRRRLWQQGNHWYRPDYLKVRKTKGDTPPAWSLSETQAIHLERLLDLLTDGDIGKGDELLTVEVLRQLRRFDQAMKVLESIPSDSHWNAYQAILIKNRMSHVGLYP
jgi:hypothetical protein